jgi:hypothetical protein
VGVKIKGQLFDVGSVSVSEGAYTRAEQMQWKASGGKRKGQEAVSVHTSVLITLHATGQWGNIVREDRTTNRVNIARGSGRVLSVIGETLPFVIMTELGLKENTTFICLPEEV